MAKKYLEIGSVIVTEASTGEKRISLGLGAKGKDPKYNLSVELTVKDSTGKVVAKQVDGFVNLIDPRTHADSLLKAGLIGEEMADSMRARGLKTPEKIKYKLQVPSL